MTAFDPTISSDPLRVFHPPGVIRVVTPAEAQGGTASTDETRATGNSRLVMRAAFSRAADILRDFARMWVEAQSHRAGL